MLGFKEYLKEAVDKTELHKFARREYSAVAADLPRSGSGHHDAAHDHVTDRMSEKFNTTHPNVNFRKETKHALKGYADDDRKETRHNEKAQSRRLAAAEKARNKPVKEKPSYWKKAGYSHDLGGSKPRKGIGSH